jgi:hypothetical protein
MEGLDVKAQKDFDTAPNNTDSLKNVNLEGRPQWHPLELWPLACSVHPLKQ